MRYWVTFRVDARYIAEVEAADPKSAMQEAEWKFQEADFGEAEDITGEPVMVEDIDGNYVWEK